MFQLIIRKSNERTLEEFFSRGQVLEVNALPYRLAGRSIAGVDAVASQLGSAMLEFSQGEKGDIEVTIAQPGMPSTTRRTLYHGDCLEVVGAVVYFFLQRERPKVSWRSSALGTLAMVGVVLALVSEIAAFCAVPFLMSRSNRWRRQGELQAINYQTDALRKRLRKMESSDPVKAVYLDALRAELDERARFLRRHGEAMSDSARQAMLENLRRLETLTGRLVDSPQFLLPPAELQVDGPVQRIIEAQ
ncbi:MAG: hypothetical protein IKO65_02015 [Victivallales bacterium]|nr:hypothetical protein [Victivallales bacterium]